MTNIRQIDSLCVCLVTELCLTMSDPKDCTYKAPLSMRFCTQKYCCGLLFPSLRDLPYLGIKLASAAFPSLTGRILTIELAGKQTNYIHI